MWCVDLDSDSFDWAVCSRHDALQVLAQAELLRSVDVPRSDDGDVGGVVASVELVWLNSLPVLDDRPSVDLEPSGRRLVRLDAHPDELIGTFDLATRCSDARDNVLKDGSDRLATNVRLTGVCTTALGA